MASLSMLLSPDELRLYLQRIGFDGPPAPDRPGLDRLQRQHRRSIPFENLDVILGRGVSLEPQDLVAKLVGRRRGGYCFEQNGLFLLVLRTIGVEARPLMGRVWLGATDTPPLTHTLNLVCLAGDEWICEVGFGGSFLPLMRLIDGEGVATDDGVRHRLDRDVEHGWMLLRDAGEGWQRQYSFTKAPVWPSDLEVANHYTSTCPDRRFTTLRIASMPTEGGYESLIDRTLTVSERGASTVRTVASADEWRRLVKDRFGIVLRAEEVDGLGLFETPAGPSPVV